VKTALQNGATLNQITCGKPVGGGKPNRLLRIASFKRIMRHRSEDPDFARIVASAIANGETSTPAKCP
jgi:hypothetical protein